MWWFVPFLRLPMLTGNWPMIFMQLGSGVCVSVSS